MALRKATIDCPGCGRRLIAPAEDWKGASKCPACAAVFTPGRPTAVVPPKAEARAEPGDASETRVRANRRRRRGRRLRRPDADAELPLVTRAAKIAFFAGTAAHVVFVLFAPGSLERADATSSHILMAPIVGIYAAIVTLLIQTYPRRGPQRLGLRETITAAGFVVGCVIGFVMFVLSVDRRGVHWTDIGQGLFFAPFGGLILAL